MPLCANRKRIVEEDLSESIMHALVEQQSSFISDESSGSEKLLLGDLSDLSLVTVSFERAMAKSLHSSFNENPYSREQDETANVSTAQILELFKDC